MNGNKFSSRWQKGLWSENGKICNESFNAEGEGKEKDICIEPGFVEIKSLSGYFDFLNQIHKANEDRLERAEKECGSLFLYRGQRNISWGYCPSIMRHEKDLAREHLILKEFHRRFYETFDTCKTMFEEEVLLQHYGVGSRCLDLMENPLIALWAACERPEYSDDENEPGEVSIWCLDNDDDQLKAFDSSTVSVIANTAKMEKKFALGHLEIEYHKEHPAELQDFIYLKDILRRAVIARPKYNNPRIRNQQGCFAIVNLNRLTDEDGEFQTKFGISVDELSDYILNASIKNANMTDEYQYPNLRRLRDGTHTLFKNGKKVDFSELTAWDLRFEKITPDESEFVDSFGLYRYMYSSKTINNKSRFPVYAVIQPEHKKNILKELKYLNITKAFVYPEMENVAKEMRETFCLEGKRSD